MYATFDLDLDLLNRMLGLNKNPVAEPAEKPRTPRAQPDAPATPAPLAELLAPLGGGVQTLLSQLLGGRS
jgi:hypothetical protein